MNILNKLNEKIGGSTFGGKTGLVNQILSYIEIDCGCCGKKFVHDRVEGLQLAQTRYLCNECYKTIEISDYGRGNDRCPQYKCICCENYTNHFNVGLGEDVPHEYIDETIKEHHLCMDCFSDDKSFYIYYPQPKHYSYGAWLNYIKAVRQYCEE